MHKTTIIEPIVNLSTLYDVLNQSWKKDTCSNDAYQVYRQKEYWNIYDRLNGINIESIIIEIIANSISDKVISRLRGLIQDNIQIYEARQEDFKRMNVDSLYKLWEEYLFGDKRAILLRDMEIIKEYPYPTEREREMLIKDTQKEINEHDNERNDLYRSDASWIGKKYYSDIYNISLSFASIIENYFPTDENKKEEEEEQDKGKDKDTTLDLQQGYYFDMAIVSAIHKECNDEQFEDISELDLYAVLNLLTSNSQLTIKKGELNRIYYLVHKLYECLPKEINQAWRTGILNNLNLNERSYQSKYRLAKGRDSTPELVEYSKRLDNLFSRFSQ